MAAPEQDSTQKAQPPTEMKTYQMVFLRRGANWSAEKTLESAKIFDGHMGHIISMHKMGKMPLAGPFMGQAGTGYSDLAGICVYNVDSKEEAEQLASLDPAVKAGRFVFEVLQWYGPTALLTLEFK